MKYKSNNLSIYSVDALLIGGVLMHPALVRDVIQVKINSVITLVQYLHISWSDSSLECEFLLTELPTCLLRRITDAAFLRVRKVSLNERKSTVREEILEMDYFGKKS